MLPYSYNEDRCTLLPVNPNLLFAYWDYSEETWNRLSKLGAPLTLLLKCRGEKALFAEVPIESKNYYFTDLQANSTYTLTVAAREGEKLREFLTSNPANTPADKPSENTAVHYMKLSLEQPLPAIQDAAVSQVNQKESWAAYLETRGIDKDHPGRKEASFYPTASGISSGAAENGHSGSGTWMNSMSLQNRPSNDGAYSTKSADDEDANSDSHSE